MKILLAGVLLVAILLSGCQGDEGRAAAKGPSGPCKHLFISHSRDQALVSGSFGTSRIAEPPSISEARVSAMIGERATDQRYFDIDGCARLVLDRAGAYTFRANVPSTMAGCFWSASSSQVHASPGFSEVKLVLQHTCES